MITVTQQATDQRADDKTQAEGRANKTIGLRRAFSGGVTSAT